MKNKLKIKVLLGILILSFAPLFSSAHAASDVKEGYDENTEITVKGTVVEVMKGMMMGPVVVRLKFDSKIYNVVTAPPWYLSQKGISFRSGSEWEIKGSKYFGRDGNVYIIGRQLKNAGSGQALVLRDTYCRPLWMGHRGHNSR
ncbi:MAG: hypothetical protein M1510_12660 [Nitrospirae bacterium]|nr:hypothetical protein [Nitrospirota bacterium]